jgi:outer membrane receptor for ferrienterochelin and colicins
MQRVEISAPGTAELRRDETVAKIVVGRSDIVQYGDSNLAEVLKRQPGIAIVGGQVRMRGLGAGYTQILINGDPAPQGFAIDSLAPELIERIEIARSASADQSAQAIAGSINLILRKNVSSAQREGKASLGYDNGRFNPGVSAQLGDRRGSMSWSLAASLNRTVTERSPQTAERVTGADGAPLAVREFDEFNRGDDGRLNLAPRLNWAWDDGETVSWQNLFELTRWRSRMSTHEQTQYGRSTSYPDSDARARSGVSSLRSDLAWSRRIGADGKLSAKAGVERNRRQTAYLFRGFKADAAAAALLRAVDSSADDDNLTLSGKYLTPVRGKHSLGLGWDASHATRGELRLQTDRTPGAAVPEVLDQQYTARVRRLALFAQDEWDIAARLQGYLGLRWEGLQSATTGRNFDEVQNRSSVWSPMAQVLWKLPGRDKDQVRMALARTYKAPLTRNLVPRRFTVNNNNSPANPDVEGNPALRPELSWGLDLAWETYFGKGGVMSMSGYARRIDDVTVQRLYQQGGQWVERPENFGSAAARGIEFDAKVPLGAWLAGAAGLELRANASRNWSRLDAVPGPYNRLADQVPLSANIGMDYRPGAAWNGGFNLNYQGGGTASSSAESSSYRRALGMLDIYGVWTMAGRTRLRVSLSNALARDREAGEVYASTGGGVSRHTITPGSVGVRVTLERPL